MNIWEILGIPPTTDIVAIKKAYADRAKEWHPEEHPEEFKRLRNAYQTAVRWAKSGGAGKVGASVEPPTAKQVESQAAKPQSAKNEPQSEKPQQEKPQQESPQQQKQQQGAPQEERVEEEEPQPQFSYDDVSSFYQKEVEEQFFREFYWIAWNPYLQNRKAVWHYFLLRPEYDDLYCHEDFWRKFLQEICAIPGWYVETLEYFEWWQDLCRDTGIKWQGDDSRMNTDNKQWSRKKWRCNYNINRVLPASKEQILEHMSILKTMEERGMDATLLNAASAAAYLKYYQAFMKDNEKWLERQRRFIRRKLLKYRMVGIWLLFLAIILVLVLMVRVVMSVVKAEEMREQRKQEKAILREERENQREWQQELDERFENMQEQYRDWMEQ